MGASAVWVSNLCFQPIIYYSLVLSCRMLINKWERLLAHPKVSKNGCMINKWFKRKLFMIRWVGLGSQRLMHRIKMGGEIFQKWCQCIQPFLLQQCLSSKSTTLSRSIRARQLGIRI